MRIVVKILLNLFVALYVYDVGLYVLRVCTNSFQRFLGFGKSMMNENKTAGSKQKNSAAVTKKSR